MINFILIIVLQIQTPKGAFWVSQCYCSYIDSTLVGDSNGDTDLKIACNQRSPNGTLSVLTGMNI